MPGAQRRGRDRARPPPCRYVRECEKLGARRLHGHAGDGLQGRPARDDAPFPHRRRAPRGLPIDDLQQPGRAIRSTSRPRCSPNWPTCRTSSRIKESSGERPPHHRPAQRASATATPSSSASTTSSWKASMLGIDGWVAGTGIAFPAREPVPLGADARRPMGRGARACTAGSRRCCTSTRT